MKRDLAELSSRQFDILVIGGGIHGALVAWDAALRGLSVALIERGDFGGATSQNSLKIIHGGLRYLQDGNLSRIRTMARERTTWMRVAPHLVHPLDCLMPTRKKLSRSRMVMGAALALNDLLSFDRNRSMDPQKHLAAGRTISRQELSQLLPGYDASAATGAAFWHDAQIYNSERLLLEFLHSAVHEGAEVANYVEATSLLKVEKRITGVSVRDLLTGQDFEVLSKVVINCSGAWTEEFLLNAALPSGYGTSIAMNLVVDQVWPELAAGLPSQPSADRPGQILFFVPWQDKTMIGTWHIPWDRSPSEFKLTKVILLDFIREINSAHPGLKLKLENVHHVTWGFLPVNKKDAGRKTVKLTRDGVIIDHRYRDGWYGLITVLGVKYTTARHVAEQAVNMAVRSLGVKAKMCQTGSVPVHGGWIGDFNHFMMQALSKAPRGMDEETIEHLVYTHGSEYRRFIKDVVENPHWAERVDPKMPVIAGELIHAVRYEMALRLSDVVQRRTELGAAGLPSMDVLQKCAQLMGDELGWSQADRQREIDCVVQEYPLHNMESVSA